MPQVHRFGPPASPALRVFEGLPCRCLIATWLGLRLLPLCIAALVTFSASAEPVFHIAYRVRVSDRGIFSIGPMEVASPVATADGFGVVVGGGSGRLLVLDAASGEISFEVQLDGGVSATPLVLQDRFIVGTDNGSIYQVGTDGRFLWPKPANIKGAIRGRPALWHDSVIVVADDTSTVHAISMADGSVLASFAGQSFARRGLSPFTVFGYPDPLVDGDVAYVGFETGFVAALKPKAVEGSSSVSALDSAWQVGVCSAGELSRSSAVSGPPLCSPRRVFRDVDTSPTLVPAGLVTGCYCRGLLLLDPANGAVRWEVPILGPSAPAVAADRLYVQSGDDRLRALEQTTGKVIWTTRLAASQVLSPVLVGSGDDPSAAMLAVPTGGPLYLVRAGDGHVVGRFDAPGGIGAPPLAMGRSLFFVTGEGFLYRIDVFP